MSHFKVMKLSPNAILPKRHHHDDAGYDLYSYSQHTVEPRQKKIIPLGIAIEMPECPFKGHVYCFRVASRSGLSAKHSIEVGAGVIDAAYRGELHIILHNHSDVEYVISPGDKIAQAMIISVAIPDVVEVESLSDTVRGSNGFGSTGKK